MVMLIGFAIKLNYMARKVILDMDPGIDDALAIMLACNSPELEIVGITTVTGNTYADRGAVNALKTLDVLGRDDVGVYVGQGKPLLRSHEPEEWVHGSDGLGDAGIPEPRRRPEKTKAVNFIVDTVMNSRPKEITIVATGPLTNIAASLILEPEVAGRVRDIVIMGGAYGLTSYGFGNSTPVSEFNIFCDPEAAKIVFESGAPLTAVGLDVTMDPSAVITPKLHEELSRRNSKLSKFAAAISKRHIDLFGLVALHDPMAVAYVVDSSLFRWERYPVTVVVGDGLTRGQTIVDRRPRVLKGEVKPNADVVYWVDGPRFLNLFMERIT